MSSEWDVGDGGNGPMFRQWANNFVDEDWGFGALNEDDWYVAYTKSIYRSEAQPDQE